MQGLEMELKGFVAAVLSGMTAVCAYVCVRKIRKVFKHSRMMIDMEDAVYWICMALYLFDQIYHMSNGVIRWYFVTGVVAGAIVFCLIEKRIQKKVNTYVKKRKRIP